MAFVFCQRHGGHVAPLLCSHLREAVRLRLPLPAVYYIEAWYRGEPAWAHHICPICAQNDGITENPTIWTDDESLERLFALDHDVAPVCPRCFDESKAGA